MGTEITIVPGEGGSGSGAGGLRRKDESAGGGASEGAIAAAAVDHCTGRGGWGRVSCRLFGALTGAYTICT